MTWARKVFVSEEMAAEWWTRTDDGRRISVEWGEPDEEGFYAPTLTAYDDGWVTGLLAAARAEARAERDAELREAVEELGYLRMSDQPEFKGVYSTATEPLVNRRQVLALLESRPRPLRDLLPDVKLGKPS